MDGNISAAYVGPTRSSIPNDIGLSLEFPPGIEKPVQKIMYTLWKEGTQPLSNLMFLTDLNIEEIYEILVVLRDADIVGETLIQPFRDSNQDNRTASLYKLNK